MKGDGVSEVIGAIILISVAVLAMGIVVLVLFAGPLPTSVPAFAGIISNSSRTVYISHEGGDTLYTGQFKILVDGVDETYNFTKSLSGPFSLGKVMSATLPNMPGRVVMVFNTSWGGGTVLLSADLVHVIPFTPAGWYSSNWLKRKKTTINPSKVSGSLTDFPVLISIADLRLQGYAQSNGNDILFTSSDGTTKLAHEIEYYNNNGGILVAWVKVPSVTSASDTVIYMYYNNSAASSQQNPTGVWTNGFQGVWHLTSVFTDSTSNGNNGVNVGSTDTSGQMARARSFDGNDYITVTGQLGQPATVTLSAWASLTARDTAGAEVITIQDNATLRMDTVYQSAGTAGSFFNTTGKLWVVTPSGINHAGTGWHYLTYVCNPGGSSEIIYTDGIARATTTWNEGIQYSPAGPNTFIGKHPVLSTYDFNGVIDEVRVSNVVRSGDWITTEYANQNSPGTFSSLGTEQTQATMS